MAGENKNISRIKTEFLINLFKGGRVISIFILLDESLSDRAPVKVRENSHIQNELCIRMDSLQHLINLSARYLKNFRENILYFKRDMPLAMKKRVLCIMVGRERMFLISEKSFNLGVKKSVKW